MPASALEITEIMYDAPGTDTDLEWIEVYNDANTSIALSNLKLFEANVNHGLTAVAGGETLSAGSYLVIASNAAAFQSAYPSFLGMLADSSFSLANTGETIAIKNNDAIAASATYPASMGAAGDGNTLSNNNGSWHVSAATPGKDNASEASGNTDNEDEDEEESSATQTTTPAKKKAATTPAEPVYTLSVETEPVIISGKTQVYTALPVRTLGDSTLKLKGGVYEWSMGDGSAYVKQNDTKIEHAYAYPGTYQLILSYYPSRLTYQEELPLVVYRKKMTVVTPAITLTGSPQSGTISLKHTSSEDLDLSGWYLKVGNDSFMFPKNTIALARTDYTFTQRQMRFGYTGGVIELLYPNREVFTASAVPVAQQPRVSSRAVSSTAQSPLAAVVYAAEPDVSQNVDPAPPEIQKQKSPAAFVVLFGFLGMILLAVIGSLALYVRFGGKNNLELYRDTDETADALPLSDIIELSDDEA